ncbi:MAG: shikimate kinase [Rubellimicrobium sp.]|nr:shikimate kinase [Rubellimicrobium sp.]
MDKARTGDAARHDGRHPQLRRGVALVGMMGAGKTAVGRVLAQKLGVPFLDSDAAIEEAAQATIAEIFARDGQEFFRAREAEVIARLLSGPPAILSTGGGAYMQERVRALIHDAGVALWLNADLATLWARVRHRDTRPLLRTPDPYATLAGIYERRVPVYALAELSIRVAPHFSVEETAARALDVLATRPDVLG